MNVLIVDDEPLARERLAQMLAEVPGTRVVGCAANGREAIDRIRELEPGVVLMDIQMPIMDGYEAAAEIRADDRFDAIPIIAMTAHAQSTEREKCLAAGMQDHITKPVRFESLAEKLKLWHPDRRSAPLTIPDSARGGQKTTIEPGF